MTIPLATYRLQLTPSFGFSAAGRVLPYLKRLGVDTVYASPIFRARQGSDHGYDIVDPNRLNPELGGRRAFEELTAQRKRLGMGWLQDIVPNHMAYCSQNAWLMDLLEHGRQSRCREFFDIDWNYPDPSLCGRVSAPFLGRPLREVIDAGEIHLELTGDGFRVVYYEHRFPLALATYGRVLRRLADGLGEQHARGSGSSASAELLALAKAFDEQAAMPWSPAKDDALAAVKQRLWHLARHEPGIRKRLGLDAKTGRLGGLADPAFLHELLEAQVFHPAFWQEAQRAVNYRRFFYLNDYIGVRVERPEVMDETHRLITELVADGTFTGLRIDHVDGLYDPTAYLRRLRERFAGVYLVVEKILELEEPLPADWPVHGATGYAFANYVNGLFCDPRGEAPLTRAYHDFIGSPVDYESLLFEKKTLVCDRYLRGDIRGLVASLSRLLDREAAGPAAQPDRLEEAMIAIMAGFGVYRRYIRGRHVSPQARAYIERAVETAVGHCPDLAPSIHLIGAVLLLDDSVTADAAAVDDVVRWVMRFQQVTAPAMAKGFEDTLLYVYNRLISLNEVGGDPSRFGISPDAFHAFNAERRTHWPHAMNATATHDTKRGEDVRARLNVLSEVPDEWSRCIGRWRDWNAAAKGLCEGQSAPAPNDEYLLYQTLVGVWPFEAQPDETLTRRLCEYLLKAVREAKVHTTWAQPNTAYEEACRAFVQRVLADSPDNAFLRDFKAFQSRIAWFGVFNALSQTLLKIASPGVPDFYQGTEVWELSLVDPDNRRPVDYEKRAAFLDELVGSSADVRARLRAALDRPQDGRLKLFLIQRALAARAAHREVFENGDYVPLAVHGRYADHIVAFLRRGRERSVLVVVPRLLTSVVNHGVLPLGADVWADTRIEAPVSNGRWQDAITGVEHEPRAQLPVGQALGAFPVSLLIGPARG